MGAKGSTKYSLVKEGVTFGEWVVIGQVFIDRYAKIPCKCSCGITKDVDAYSLTSGKSRSCKQCGISQKTTANPSWKGYEEIPQSWFSGFKRNAKRGFNITLQDVWHQYLIQDRKCALSGLDIGFTNLSLERGNRSFTASIDRIDSKKGYVINNIQLVHKDVNIMKNAFSQDRFFHICKLVVETNNK